MTKPLFMTTALVLMASMAMAEPITDRLVQQLYQQGFTEVEVERTWLGRVRIEAEGPQGEREIILNPRTGEILRDYWEVEDAEHIELVDPREGQDGQDDEAESSDSDEADDDAGKGAGNGNGGSGNGGQGGNGSGNGNGADD